ncbi:hypothetical protein DFH11DRAFT_1512518 [Phellopilus nigrolimitatus]|nr:hypothetical protein DFH11DRAFT_1512518 [Phellopilus nigrolimitatus]
MTAKHRPPEVSTWMKTTARPLGDLSTNNPEKFADYWQKWWTSSQPLWRRRLGISPMPRKDTGKEGMEELRYAGRNGLYVYVVSLAMWASAKKPTRSSDKKLEHAVDDLTWALSCLNAARRKHPRDETNEGPEPANKR